MLEKLSQVEMTQLTNMIRGIVTEMVFSKGPNTPGYRGKTIPDYLDNITMMETRQRLDSESSTRAISALQKDMIKNIEEASIDRNKVSHVSERLEDFEDESGRSAREIDKLKDDNRVLFLKLKESKNKIKELEKRLNSLTNEVRTRSVTPNVTTNVDWGNKITSTYDVEGNRCESHCTGGIEGALSSLSEYISEVGKTLKHIDSGDVREESIG